MEVGEAIVALDAGERPGSFDQFSAAIDPQWIADALAATDTASVRRRKLPAEHVVWLVIGMGLFRDRSIAQVVHHLDLVVPALTGARRRVTNAAIVQARDQLGAAAFGPYRTSELALATQAWAALPEHALVILDRGFCSYALFHALATPDRDRHWVVRARSGPTALTQAIVQRFGPGDALVELRPSPATCAKYPDLPPTLRVRAVRVQRRGFRPYWVFTSLRNPATHPAAELAALYHERWELELAFDELKTHTCERAEALRSKAPARVEQEVWGLLLAYNLVRLVMSRAAPRARVPPLRLSYRYALLAVRAFWHAAWDTSPGTLPRRLEALLDELALFVLPERRPRRYPRAVKLKMSNYPRNRPHRRRSRAK